MIEIRVQSLYGQPPTIPLLAQFDELGGTIGRAEGNGLVLLDPERRISRIHAQIVYRNGQYLILDQGSAINMRINERPLAQGAEAVLADGDRIELGNYVLSVSVPQAAAAAQAPATLDDPLALFGAPAPHPYTAPQPHREPKPEAPRVNSLLDDPFAAPSAGTIPADYDPFADLRTPSSATTAGGALDLGPGTRERSLDELFGLTPGQAASGLPAHGLLAEPQQAADVLDPLVAFGAAPAVPTAPSNAQPDQTPEIRGTFRLPAAEPVAAPAAAASDMVLSWEAPDKNAINTVMIGAIGQETPANIPHPAAVAEPAAPGEDGAPRADIEAPAGPAATVDVLQAAFLQGLGLPSLDLGQGLTPPMMRLFGELLRESVQGTLDLLLARATFKRELRAEMTMIVPRENNPLKFSPNVEAALAQLISPRLPGFMPPAEAMRDAYDDLRAHQLGFMVGMRAALDDVLRRFDPAQLEQRLSHRSALDSVLPMNRRAKLWDLFAERYADISKEASDDFQALFGREFVRAYEAQIARLEANAPDTRA